MSSADLNPRKDPAEDTNATTCKYNSKVMKNSVYRAKQYLVRGHRNVAGCKKVSRLVKEKPRRYMLKKKE